MAGTYVRTPAFRRKISKAMKRHHAAKSKSRKMKANWAKKTPAERAAHLLQLERARAMRRYASHKDSVRSIGTLKTGPAVNVAFTKLVAERLADKLAEGILARLTK